ncbi:hypothetical protein M3Y95_00877500 [Aphelenchoides besseyi]|nr:hypothetical protein M3Y95_00877500 [Aphelenchoides besseyi]
MEKVRCAPESPTDVKTTPEQDSLAKRRVEMEKRKADKLKAEEEAKKAREEADRLAKQKLEDARKAKELEAQKKKDTKKPTPEKKSTDKTPEQSFEATKPAESKVDKTPKPATTEAAADEPEAKKLGKKDIKQLPKPEDQGMSEAQKRQEELKRKREEAARQKEEQERLRKEEEERLRLQKLADQDAELAKAKKNAEDASEKEKQAKSSAQDDIAKRRAEMEKRKAEKLKSEEDAKKTREEADRLAKEKLEEKRKAKELEEQKKKESAAQKKTEEAKNKEVEVLETTKDAKKDKKPSKDDQPESTEKGKESKVTEEIVNETVGLTEEEPKKKKRPKIATASMNASFDSTYSDESTAEMVNVDSQFDNAHRRFSISESNTTFTLKKARTERIGIGVTLNMNLEISDVDCECEFAKELEDEEVEMINYMSAYDEVDSVVTPMLIVSVTDTDETLELQLALSPQDRKRRRKVKKIVEPRLAVSREKSPFGTHYMNIDIDIDAGEETASTDGVIGLEPVEYAESESSITIEEDFMDIDVDVKDIDDFRADSIEAILPKSPIRASATQLVLVKSEEAVSLEIKQPPIEQQVETSEGDKKSKKKVKKIPHALEIPDEINSLYGDPSVLVSTANINEQLTAGIRTETAESVSPLPEPTEVVSKQIESAPSSAQKPKDEAADFAFKQVKENEPEPAKVEPDQDADAMVKLEASEQQQPLTVEEKDSVVKSEFAKRRAEMDKRKADKLKVEEDARKAREEADRLAKEKLEEKRKAKELEAQKKKDAKKPADSTKQADEQPKQAPKTAEPLESTKLKSKDEKPSTTTQPLTQEAAAEEPEVKKLGKKDIKQLPKPEDQGMSEAQERQEELKRKREEAARQKEEQERLRKEEEERLRLQKLADQDAELAKAKKNAEDASEKEKQAKSSAQDDIAKRRAEMEKRKAEKLKSEEDARKAREEADRLAKQKLEDARKAKELEAQKKKDIKKPTPEKKSTDKTLEQSSEATKPAESKIDKTPKPATQEATQEAVAEELEAKKLNKKDIKQLPKPEDQGMSEAQKRQEELKRKREEAARLKEEQERLRKEEEERLRLQKLADQDAELAKAKKNAEDASEKEKQAKLSAQDDIAKRRAEMEKRKADKLKIEEDARKAREEADRLAKEKLEEKRKAKELEAQSKLDAKKLKKPDEKSMDTSLETPPDTKEKQPKKSVESKSDQPSTLEVTETKKFGKKEVTQLPEPESAGLSEAQKRQEELKRKREEAARQKAEQERLQKEEEERRRQQELDDRNALLNKAQQEAADALTKEKSAQEQSAMDDIAKRRAEMEKRKADKLKAEEDARKAREEADRLAKEKLEEKRKTKELEAKKAKEMGAAKVEPPKSTDKKEKETVETSKSVDETTKSAIPETKPVDQTTSKDGDKNGKKKLVKKRTKTVDEEEAKLAQQKLKSVATDNSTVEKTSEQGSAEKPTEQKPPLPEHVSAMDDIAKRRAELEKRKAEKLKAEEDARKAREEADRLAKEKLEEKRKTKELEAQSKLDAKKTIPEKKPTDKTPEQSFEATKPAESKVDKTPKPATTEAAADEPEAKKLGKKDIKQLPKPEDQGMSEAQKRQEELKRKREEAARQKEEQERLRKEEEERLRLQKLADQDAELAKAKKNAEDASEKEKQAKSSAQDDIAKRRAEMEKRKAEKLKSEEDAKKTREEADRLAKEKLEEKRKAKELEAQSKLDAKKPKSQLQKESTEKTAVDDVEKVKSKTEKSIPAPEAETTVDVAKLRKPKEQPAEESKPPQDEATRRLEELRKRREEAAKQKEEQERLRKEEEERLRLQKLADQDAELAKAQQAARDAAERQSKVSDEEQRKRAEIERQLEERLKAEAEKNKMKMATESGLESDATASAATNERPDSDAVQVKAGEKGAKPKKIVKKRRPRPEAETDESGEVRWKKDDGSKSQESAGEESTVDVSETVKLKPKDDDDSTVNDVDEFLRKRQLAKAASFEEEQLDDISEYLRKRAARAVETEVAETYVRATRHRQKRAGFVTPPEHTIYALRGDRVVIECELFNEEDEVEWTWNDANIDRDPRCSFEDYGYIRRLVIKDIVPADSGSIATVQLSNDILSTTVLVDETPVEFVRKLERKTIAIAGEVTMLNVELSHNAEQVRWFFNGQLIAADATGYRIIADGIVQALQIMKPSYELEGRYSVQADQSETSTVLEVHGKPVSTIDEMKTIEVDAQEVLNWRVPILSNPEPDVALFLNDESLFADIRTTIEIRENQVYVSRRGMRKTDAGTMRLKLTNEFGENIQEVKVIVNDTPEAPLRLVVTEVGHDFATVAWDKPKHDGGSLITGYIIEKKDINRRVFQRVGQVSGHKNNLYVDELDMETTYLFRVAAFNRFGIGEYSDSVEVSTGIPYVAPSMYTSPIISHVSDKSCYLEWEDCSETGGSPIYSYDIFMREEGGDWHKANSEPCFATNFWIHDQLKPGSTYQFKVEASNEAGLTSNSNVASESVHVPKSFDVPNIDLPTPNVKVSSMDTAEISWQPPSEYQTNEDIKYTVYYKSEGNAVWNEITTKKTNVQIEDLKEGVAYVFKVAAQNEAGIGRSTTETEPTIISAYQRPTITKPIRNTVVPRKRELRLDCHAFGEPTPTYSWWKNGNEIVPQDDNISISNEGFVSVLTIHETNNESAGVFECRVKNSYGEDRSKAEVTIGDVRAHFLRSFPEHFQLNEHKNLELECELSDEEAVVQWLKNQRPLRESDRVQIQKSGPLRRLVITDATAEDSGEYICQTSDERSYTRSRVSVKEEIAHIHLSPQDQIVKSMNEKVVLRCELTHPVPSAKWFKNGLEIWELSGKHFPINDDYVLTLEIMNFDEKDVGTYVVELPNGERSVEAQVLLQIAPHIELSREVRTDRELVAFAGSELTFTIKMSGYPLPRFEGLLNEETLRHFASVDDFDESNINVRIAPVNSTHAGQVSLRATNECGEDVRRFTIRVIDVPAAPKNVEVELLSGTAVEVSWNPIADNPDAPVDYYIVERKTAEHSRWRQSAKIRSQQPCRAIVDELFSDEIYVFRVVAVNDVGRGHPSVTVDIVTPTDEEEDISIMSSTSLGGGVERSIPDQPKRPQLEIVNKRAELQWESVENCTVYAVERKRAGPDEMWLEIANTDRTHFIDRSVFTSGTYAYRIVAKFLKTRSKPSESTNEVNLEAQILRRSSSASSVVAGRDESPTGSDDRSTSSTLKSRGDSGIGFVESSEEVSRAEATKSTDGKPPTSTAGTKKRIVKKKPKTEDDSEAAAKPPRPQSSIEETNEPAKFELTKPMADVEAEVGGQAEFTCSFADVPPSTFIYWSKDGTRISTVRGRKYKSTLSGGDASLVISEVTNSDSGIYKCEIVDGEQEGKQKRGETYGKLNIRSGKPSSKSEITVDADNSTAETKTEKPTETPKKKRLVKKRTTSDLSQKSQKSVDTEKQDASTVEPKQIAPRFEVQLSDTTVQLGKDCVLDCRVIGKPQCEVKWFKDNQLLRMDNRHLEYTDRQGVIRLNLLDCRSDDQATYAVEVKNQLGIERSSCVLTVDSGGGDKQGGRQLKTEDTNIQEQNQKNLMAPSALDTEDRAPFFSYALRDLTVLLGESKALKCRIEAQPDPQIEWLKNEKPIKKSKRLRISQNDNVYALKISNAVAEDTGAYSCLACNRAGSSQSECFLTVASACGPDSHLVGVDLTAEFGRTKPDNEKPKFTQKPPAELRVPEGQPIELRAHAIGSGITTKWLKDNKEITRTNPAYKIRVMTNGDQLLDIDCALPRTAGTFSFVASNSNGEIRCDTKIEVSGRKLSSIVNQKQTEPKFVESLKDVYVALGKPLTLRCSFEGDPSSVEWFFVDDLQTSTPLALLKNVWTEYRPSTSSAEIRSVAAVRTQQGTYQCVLSSASGRAISSGYVTVGEGNRLSQTEAPRFTKCLQDCWTSLGETVVFSVDVMGTPIPQITWYINDKRIDESSEKYNISNPSVNSFRLEIKDVQINDIGTYSAHASNSQSLIQTTATLNIGDPFDFQLSNNPNLQIHDVDMESEIESTMDDAFGGNEFETGISHPHRHPIKRKGAAPTFVIGLHDMELQEGKTGAVAGKMQPKKRRHRLFETRADEDPKNLLGDSLVAHVDDEDQRPASVGSPREQHGDNTTLDQIRSAIAKRNQKLCAPKFYVKPKPRKEIEEHKSLRLKAAISANPPAKLQWDKDGVILETGNKYSIFNDGDFFYLEVHHVSIFDRGFLNLSAVNSQGCATCTCEVVVRSLPDTPMEKLKKRTRRDPIAPSFIDVLPGRMKITVGQELTVECSLTGFPTPSISWHRNGLPLLPQPDRCFIYFDGETTTLRLSCVSTSDAGTYMVIAENSSRAMAQMDLEVIQPDVNEGDGLAPAFVETRQKYRKVIDGRPMEIETALIQGTEPLKITWTHDNIHVKDSTAFRYKRAGKSPCLIIADPFPEDSGLWTCVVENKFGQSTAHIDLTIIEQVKSPLTMTRPIITSNQPIIWAEPGATVDLVFRVIAKPEPVISWYLNDQKLTPCTIKYETVNKNPDFILRIHDVRPEDSATYQLEAINNAGQSSENVKLEVSSGIVGKSSRNIAAPKFTKLPLSVQCTHGQTAKLECEFEGQPIPQVQWFRGSERLHSNDDFEIQQPTSTSSRLIITSVTEQTADEYLCTIRNSGGEALGRAQVMLEEGSTSSLSVRSLTARCRNVESPIPRLEH